MKKRSPDSMKFRISSILVFTAFIALGLVGYVGIKKEREKQRELQQQISAVVSEVNELKMEANDIAQKHSWMMADLNDSLNLLADVDRGEMHIVRIDNYKYEKNVHLGYPKRKMSWRLFLPNDSPPVELCMAVNKIPDTGFPEEYETFDVDPMVKWTVDSTGGPAGWSSTSSGNFIVEFELGAFENTTNQGMIARFGCLEMNAQMLWKPASRSRKSRKLILEHTEVSDMKWLPRCLAEIQFQPDIADWRVCDFGPFSPEQFSLEQPVELFRIRGKRLVDGRFNKVDGPAPGFMAWMRIKPDSD